MKKLHAFTLLELLIGMIISSIVIGFGYSGYNLIYKRYLNYSETKKGITNIIQLNSVLNNDFINASSAQFESDKLILNYKNGLLKTYNFKDKLILREEAEHVDTFKLEVNNLMASQNIDVEQMGLPITQLSFDAIIHKETMHFRFEKSYSSETLLNLQLNQ